MKQKTKEKEKKNKFKTPTSRRRDCLNQDLKYIELLSGRSNNTQRNINFFFKYLVIDITR